MKKGAERGTGRGLEGERVSGAGRRRKGAKFAGGRINFLVRAGIANCLRTLFMV